MDWKNQQSTDQANRFAAESNQGWSRSCRGHAGELLRLVRDPEAVRDTAPVPVPRLMRAAAPGAGMAMVVRDDCARFQPASGEADRAPRLAY